jgi:hypothetical protein
MDSLFDKCKEGTIKLLASTVRIGSFQDDSSPEG